MIEVRGQGHELALVTDEDDITAFIDRDWVRRAGPVRALRVDSERAAALIGELAARAAHAVADIDPRAVRVIGQGLLAHLVRAGLRAANGAEPEQPAAIVEMSGDPDAVAPAAASLRPGGRLVLAGEYPHPVEIDLYKTVHRNGLEVVGIPEPGDTAEPEVSMPVPVPDAVTVAPGALLPPALWYRLLAPGAASR